MKKIRKIRILDLWPDTKVSRAADSNPLHLRSSLLLVIRHAQLSTVELSCISGGWQPLL